MFISSSRDSLWCKMVLKLCVLIILQFEAGSILAQTFQDCVPPGICPTPPGIDPRIVSPGGTTPPGECPPGYVRCQFPCGVTNIAPSPNDGPAVAGSFPWQAYIYLGGDRMRYIGSGVLLDHYHVLTAAHKVNETAANINVAFGVNNPADSTTTQASVVARIAVPVNYQVSTLRNDIAVIRLATAVTFANNIGPVCLPAAADQYTGRCVVGGWGRTNFGSNDAPTPFKRQVYVNIVDANTCINGFVSNTALTNARDFFDPATEICAGGVVDRDACTQDGGAPLACPRGTNYFVAGLVIWGKGCGQAGVYGVYVSVPAYRAWIDCALQCLSNIVPCTSCPNTIVR